MKTMPVQEIDKILEFARTSSIGIFGGAAYYLYQVSKGEKFSGSRFIITLVLAFFVSYIVGQFIGPTVAFRDGLIGVCSFSALPILAVLEKLGPEIARKFIK